MWNGLWDKRPPVEVAQEREKQELLDMIDVCSWPAGVEHSPHVLAKMIEVHRLYGFGGAAATARYFERERAIQWERMHLADIELHEFCGMELQPDYPDL